MQREDLIIRKSFQSTHNNGELWAENLDSLYSFTEVAEEKFLEDMKTIRRPSSPSSIAVNLNQTVITEQFAALIIDQLHSAGVSVRKVVFVGVDKAGKALFKKQFKNLSVGFAYHFFDDFMEAKDWLI